MKSFDHQRSILISFIEIAIFTALAFGTIWMLQPLTGTFEFSGQMKNLGDLGGGVIVDAGWILPSFLAIVLGFYATMIGRSFVADSPAEASALRNRLGVSAQLIAAATNVCFALAILAAVHFSNLTPRLIGIGLLWLLILVLGAGTGTFSFASRYDRRLIAERALITANRQLLWAPLRTTHPISRPARLVTLAATAVFAPLAAVSLLSFVAPLHDVMLGLQGQFLLSGIFGLLTVFVFTVLVYSALVSSTPGQTAWTFLFPALFLTLGAVVIVVTVGWIQGWATIVTAAAVVLSVGLPFVGAGRQWMLGWAILSFAITRLQIISRRAEEQLRSIPVDVQ